MSDRGSLRVLVVDDEPYPRKRLVELLENRREVATIACADSGRQAIDTLRAAAYDLVYLDVQMPAHTGIEVVETVGPSNMPTTVFVTAYDQYALKAFELAALDYLLKPFDDDRFERSFQRILDMERLQRANAVTDQFRQLLDSSGGSRLEVAQAPAQIPDSAAAADPQSDEAIETDPLYLERLTIDLPGKVRVIPVDEIRYITADDAYVKIHTLDHNYLLRERMHVLEDRLDPSKFVRIHRSTIVQLDLVETVLHSSGGDYAVRLTDRTKLKVSRTRRDDLLQRLETGTL